MREAYQEGVFGDTMDPTDGEKATRHLLDWAKGFHPGDLSRVHLATPNWKKDLVIGKLPDVITHNVPTAQHGSDGHLRTAQFMEMMSLMLWVNGPRAGSTADLGEDGLDVSLKATAFDIYKTKVEGERSHGGGLGVTPFGLTASAGGGTASQQTSGWMSAMWQWLSAGVNTTINSPEGSSVAATNIGASVGGWKSSLKAGIGVKSALKSGSVVGAGAALSISSTAL